MVWGDRVHQAQLGMFFAAVAAWVVCGCILTRKPKKAYQLCGLRCRTNISPVVSLSKKKGAVIGLAAAYRSLKKLDRLCDHLLSRAASGNRKGSPRSGMQGVLTQIENLRRTSRQLKIAYGRFANRTFKSYRGASFGVVPRGRRHTPCVIISLTGLLDCQTGADNESNHQNDSE